MLNLIRRIFSKRPLLGRNLAKPIREVHRANLKMALGGYVCPACNSSLLKTRPDNKGQTTKFDGCSLCGQSYLYMDVVAES